MKQKKLNLAMCYLVASVGFAISSSAIANASALNKGVNFSEMVSENVNLPAIKIYNAEKDIEHKRYDSAVRNYLQAITDGQTAAAFNIANLVKQGKVSGNVLQDSLKKLSALAASDGNLSYFLGVYYKEIAKEKNPTESFKWFNNSLSLGNTSAAPFVADYISTGLKAANEIYSHSNAASMLKLAADKGDFEAAYSLASMVYSDPNVTKNMSIAYKYYSQAASHDYKDASYMIGYMDEYGIGRKRDVSAAVVKYKYVLDLASSDVAYKAKAANQLAKIYMYGKDTVHQNRLTGILYLSKAAGFGSVNANEKLGFLNLYGADDFKVNIDAAISHLKTASNGGEKTATNTLFQIYENGLYGVPVDTTLAAKYKMKMLNI